MAQEVHDYGGVDVGGHKGIAVTGLPCQIAGPDAPAVRGHVVAPQVFPGDLHSQRVVVHAVQGRGPEMGGRHHQDAGAGAHVQETIIRFKQPLHQPQAERCGRMASRTEGHARIDVDHDLAGLGTVVPPGGFDHEAFRNFFGPEKGFPGFGPVILGQRAVEHPVVHGQASDQRLHGLLEGPPPGLVESLRREIAAHTVDGGPDLLVYHGVGRHLRLRVFHHDAFDPESIEDIGNQLLGRCLRLDVEFDFGFDPFHFKVHPCECWMTDGIFRSPAAFSPHHASST